MSGDTGRQDAFLTHLDQHKGILYKVARAYGRSQAERDDLVQETVAQLWQAFPRYDGSFKFSTWMYRIALNIAISWQRREVTRARHVTGDEEAVLAWTGAADAPVEDAHVALLYRCIDGYDGLDRALLMLHLDGHSHQEISAVIGLTATNVSTRLNRLRTRLRDDFRAAGYL